MVEGHAVSDEVAERRDAPLADSPAVGGNRAAAVAPGEPDDAGPPLKGGVGGNRQRQHRTFPLLIVEVAPSLAVVELTDQIGFARNFGECLLIDEVFRLPIDPRIDVTVILNGTVELGVEAGGGFALPQIGEENRAAIAAVANHLFQPPEITDLSFAHEIGAQLHQLRRFDRIEVARGDAVFFQAGLPPGGEFPMLVFRQAVVADHHIIKREFIQEFDGQQLRIVGEPASGIGIDRGQQPPGIALDHPGGTFIEERHHLARIDRRLPMAPVHLFNGFPPCKIVRFAAVEHTHIVRAVVAGVSDGEQEIDAVSAQFVCQKEETVPGRRIGRHRIPAIIHQRAAHHARIPIAGRAQHMVGTDAVDSERREILRRRRRRLAVRIECDKIDAPELHRFTGGIDEIVPPGSQRNRFHCRDGEHHAKHHTAQQARRIKTHIPIPFTVVFPATGAPGNCAAFRRAARPFPPPACQPFLPAADQPRVRSSSGATGATATLTSPLSVVV